MTKNAVQANVTGNNTLVTVVYNVDNSINTEVSPTINTGTGEVTAVLPGLYQITASVELDQATNATFGVIEIQKNGTAISRRNYSWAPAGAIVNMQIDTSEVLWKGDVVRVAVSLNGIGADTADITGAALVNEFVGRLV